MAQSPSIANPQDRKVMIRKSNSFVCAKYRASTLGNKVMAISLSKLCYDAKTGKLSAVLDATEIDRLINGAAGEYARDTNLYKKLKEVSHSLIGHIVTFEYINEQGRQAFTSAPMVTKVNYDNGRMTIEYNECLTSQLYQLKSNYTTLELTTLMAFERSPSIRLYELLKKDAWKLDEAESQVVDVEYEMCELKAMLGLIDTDAPHIVAAVQSGKSWTEIVEKVAKPADLTHSSFSDFKRRVLEPALDEMTRKSELAFTYDVLRTGRGGKARAITFHIRKNPKAHVVRQEKERVEDLHAQDIQFTETAQDMGVVPVVDPGMEEMYQEIKAFLEQRQIPVDGFTYDLFLGLFFDAGNSLSAIKEEISYSLGVKGKIDNYYGWLRSAVKNRYSKNVTPVVEGEAIDGSANPTYTAETLLNVWNIYKKQPKMDDFLEACGGLTLSELESIVNADIRIKAYIAFKTDGATKELTCLEEVKEAAWSFIKNTSSFALFIRTMPYPDVDFLEAVHPMDERLAMFEKFRRKNGQKRDA